MEDADFDGLHESRQQVAIYLHFRVPGIQPLEVVNVNKGNGQRSITALAFAAVMPDVREKEVGRLQDVELLVELAGQKGKLAHRGRFDVLNGQKVPQSRQLEMLDVRESL